MSAALMNELDRLRAENADLKFNAMEHHRLKMALSNALGHDALNPSMCDLVVEARLVIQERDAALEREQALAAQNEELKACVADSFEFSGEPEFYDAETVLKRRDLIKQAEALEEEAECLSDIEYAQDRLLESAAEKRQRAAILDHPQ